MRRSFIGAAAMAAVAALSVIHINFPGSQGEIRAVVPPRQAPRRKEHRRTRPIRALNRSRHWAYADTYKDARRISPVPHMAVR